MTDLEKTVNVGIELIALRMKQEINQTINCAVGQYEIVDAFAAKILSEMAATLPKLAAKRFAVEFNAKMKSISGTKEGQA